MVCHTRQGTPQACIPLSMLKAIVPASSNSVVARHAFAQIYWYVADMQDMRSDSMPALQDAQILMSFGTIYVWCVTRAAHL